MRLTKRGQEMEEFVLKEEEEEGFGGKEVVKGAPSWRWVPLRADQLASHLLLLVL